MKKIILTIIAVIMLAAVSSVAKESLYQPDETEALRITAETIGTDRPLHVYDLAPDTTSTSTIQIAINTMPLDEKYQTGSFTISAGATTTITLPSGTNYGNFEIKMLDTTWTTYFVEDSGARNALKSNEHLFECEGDQCLLPAAISIYNPGVSTGTAELRVRYRD